MRFTLNGQTVNVRAHPLARLLDVLREDCGLTGTKEGCGEGECGACTVIIDGAAVNACLVPFAQVRGARVTTIEGLKGRRPLQEAFVTEGGAQCGICTPGMILAASTLGPRPTREDIRTGLAGNLCRCTGYSGIYRAVERATKKGPQARKRRLRRADESGPASASHAEARRAKAGRGAVGSPRATSQAGCSRLRGRMSTTAASASLAVARRAEAGGPRRSKR